ncbi:MAG TPA: hypothetical protein VFS58_09555 [Steroidobacteraceae bacterium]|nr:hypothetical protein [Steroidobacteraceae bacterium]
MSVLVSIALPAVFVVVAGAWVHRWRVRARRENHIRTFMFPRGLFEKLQAVRPDFGPKEQQLVARALRQFFLAYLKSGCQRVAMPSQAADDLWHEFILFTRDYQLFCDIAFGQFLHHTPAVKMGLVKTDNEGLRRVWWFSCLEENIDPRKATRLPLLFALDRKLGIPNGFVYDLHCQRKRREDGATAGGTANCADDFTDSSIDGSTDGLGCSGDGGGGSGGCSGGCGGGGD